MVAPFAKQAPDRTDEYLLFRDSDTVSVKHRRGKLQVKALVAGPRRFSLSGVVGRTDQWVKWSFTPSEPIAHPLEFELDQSGSWTSREDPLPAKILLRLRSLGRHIARSAAGHRL